MGLFTLKIENFRPRLARPTRYIQVLFFSALNVFIVQLHTLTQRTLLKKRNLSFLNAQQPIPCFRTDIIHGPCPNAKCRVSGSGVGSTVGVGGRVFYCRVGVGVGVGFWCRVRPLVIMLRVGSRGVCELDGHNTVTRFASAPSLASLARALPLARHCVVSI